MLSEISQSQKRQIVYDNYLNEVSKVVRFIETERRMVIARGWGRGEWGVI